MVSRFLSVTALALRQLLACVASVCLLMIGGTVYASQPEFDLGERPAYLVDDMDEGALKASLLACRDQSVSQSQFSISHRGAPLRYPEHTIESYTAAARQGAGKMECDVTFTRDRELVCRHSQCDLHTTTNILQTPLAKTCVEPFQPADPENGKPATAKCCTSELNLDEFRSLQGRMDKVNPQATSIEEYLQVSAAEVPQPVLLAGRLITHRESIQLFKKLKVNFIPELKGASVPMPYEGEYSQADYARQLVEDYIAAGIAPEQVWLQSFDLQDLIFWNKHYPDFAKQAILLDRRMVLDQSYAPSLADFQEKYAQGVRTIAPPLFALVSLNEDGDIVPSEYAQLAKQAGLKFITWSLERSGPLSEGGGFYYITIKDVINNDGDVFKLVDALVKEVGVMGIFSDWPATTTYYANCMGLD
ncbi:MAG: glycerophosphodiester phosphodiesterase family protein [Pseudomonadota bacterium]